MGCKEVMGRENIQMPVCTHLQNSPFHASPHPYFLYPANSNLSYFIETNPAPFLSLSLFPSKGNVMEPAPGFNEKMVRRSRN